MTLDRERLDRVGPLVVRIAVALATVLFASNSAAWARDPAAAASLPVGTVVTLVADDTIDPHVRAGSEFRAHLRDPLELGQTLVATAGTSARLVVTANDGARAGTPRLHLAIVGLNLGLAGTLPVRPQTPLVEGIHAGTLIAATTLAAVAFEQGKVRVAIPLPLTLSNDPPNGGYTPAPLRTAAPVFPRHKPTPVPTPAAASPVPSPSSTADNSVPPPSPGGSPLPKPS